MQSYERSGAQEHHSPIFETGQARRVIKAIKDECQPDDDIAAMEMETKVAKIKLNKERNPKKLIEKMANIKVLYGMLPIDDKKRTGVVLRCGKSDYSAVMTATSVAVRRSDRRAATCD